jgi:uncharacterized protein with PQ loop repeat
MHTIHSMFEWFGVAATVSGLVAAWPQVARIVVRRDDTGVSIGTRRLGVFAGVAWLGIGVVNSIPATIAFNAIGLIGGLSILFVIASLHGRSSMPIVGVVVAAVSTTFVAFVVGGDLGVEILGTTLGMASYLPQLVRSVRSESTVGVSPLSWGLVLFSNSCWMAYGLSIGEWALIYPNIVMISGSLVIFFKARQSNRRSASGKRLDGIPSQVDLSVDI